MTTTAPYTLSINRNLDAEGYRFFPSSVRPDLVIVAKPNGGTYNTDLLNGTCDCAAGKRKMPCCHLREAKAHVPQMEAASNFTPAETTEARRILITTAAGFGSREAFEKARAADFD